MLWNSISMFENFDQKVSYTQDAAFNATLDKHDSECNSQSTGKPKELDPIFWSYFGVA